MKKNAGKNVTIEGSLKDFSGFVIKMIVGMTIIMTVFLAVIFVNVYNFYNVQFVTETYQMEIRKDVQTINKRLLFAVASNDSSVTADQKADLEERFPKIESYFSTISANLNNEKLGSQLTENWEAFENASYEMLDMVEKGDTKKALEYYNSTLNDVSETLADSLDETGVLAEKAAANKYKTILIIVFAALVVLVIVCAVINIINRKRSKAMITDIGKDLVQADCFYVLLIHERDRRHRLH